jgi:hypothetical protein
VNDRKMVSRVVFWANDGQDWREIARKAGYEIDDQPISGNTTEYRLSRDGLVVAVLACVDGEFYSFVFVPEARHWRDRVRYALLRKSIGTAEVEA